MLVQFFDERMPDRFWRKVIPEPMSGCWLWVGGMKGVRRPDGYGSYRHNGRSTRAHCASFRGLVGDVPANPGHLEPVTRAVNVYRGTAPAARNHAATACVHGHPFDEANTYHRAGRRHCKACMAKYSDAWKARNPDRVRERGHRNYLAMRSK